MEKENYFTGNSASGSFNFTAHPDPNPGFILKKMNLNPDTIFWIQPSNIGIESWSRNFLVEIFFLIYDQNGFYDLSLVHI